MNKEPKYMNALMLAQALSAVGSHSPAASRKIEEQIVKELDAINEPKFGGTAAQAKANVAEPITSCDCPECSQTLTMMSVEELRNYYSPEALLELLRKYSVRPETTVGEIKHLAEAARLSVALAFVQ